MTDSKHRTDGPAEGQDGGLVDRAVEKARERGLVDENVAERARETGLLERANGLVEAAKNRFGGR